MKIKFTKLPTNDGIIKVSLDGGQSFTDYNVADVHESGIPLEDNQDYEKIQVKAPANVLKNLNVVSSVKVEGEDGGESTNEHSFIMDTDTYGFDFPKCVTGIIFPKGMTTINRFANYGGSALFPNLRTIIIPESVTSIGNGAFYNCSGLTSITIPEGVTSIGSSDFNCCSSLTSITIPEGVTSIDYYVFRGCSLLRSITIPEGVTSIGTSAFSNCSSLPSITIPSSVTIIGGNAFSSCSCLRSITISEGITSIGSYAFDECSNLTSINYTGTEEQWNAINKGNNWKYGCPSDMVINYNYQG